MSSELRFQLNQFSYTYSGPQGPAVGPLDISGRSGEIVSLTGSSGSGKTTILKALAGLLAIQKGNLTVAGRAIATSRDRHALRPSVVSYVPQDVQLVRELTAEENVALPAIIQPSCKRLEARDALARLGLASMAQRFPDQLSGGEQQRVALCRALSTSATVLLLDEPSAALDQSAAESLMEAIRSALAITGGVAVIATHDPVVIGASDLAVPVKSAA